MSRHHFLEFKLLLAVLPVLLMSPTASALMLHVDMDKLVSTSESVVVGRVVSLDPHWLDGPNSIIVTEVGFAVDEVWMGSHQKSGETISLRVAGGIVGEVGMWQEHQPVFKLDDEAVLFLWQRPDGELGVAHSEQGLYWKRGEAVSGHLTELRTISAFRNSLEASKRNLGRD
jgi:hypothetical protein